MQRKLCSSDVSRFVVAFAIVVMFGIPAVAQNPKHITTNEDVIKMVKARLSSDLIIKQIQSTLLVDFDCSPQGLIDLKNAGVDERISNAMMDRSKELEDRSRVNKSGDPEEQDRPLDAKKRAKKQVVKKMGFTFELDLCKASANTIVCEAMITTSENKKQLTFGWGSFFSTMIDDSGNEHQASESKLAERQETNAFMMPLSPGVPVRAKVVFAGIENESSVLKLLRLSFSTEVLNKWENFKVDFRNVPLMSR